MLELIWRLYAQAMYEIKQIGSIILIFLILLISACNKDIKARSDIYLKSYFKEKTAKKLKKIRSFSDSYECVSEKVFLSSPSKLAQDKDGNIYIVDPRANKIFKYDRYGKLIKTIGKKGQAPGDLSGPNIIDINNEILVVNDVFNSRIQRLDLNGNFISSFHTFRGYQSLAISSEGFIFVSPILLFENRSNLIDVLTNEGIKNLLWISD